MNPNLRTPALAFPRPLRRQPTETFFPFEEKAHEPEHDFLVQNWRPDLVNEIREPETFFQIDHP